ncbi:hypothetical protein HNQ08_002691 [Deinococcus humi]|uniref:Uncharacterized protein n=1 Tax=Deinococcus humi TaxID=662880 RepID=A0A7W8NFD9_9DEIO|nr:hypothetical protein [Deinococcus humi]GGO30151.1 hypothetical protein GCM10008949_24610 [Deinococcus humi]
MEILDPSVEAQKFSGPFPPLESKLLPLLTPCGPLGVLNAVVAVGRPDHLLMLHASQAGQGAESGLIAPETIRVDHLWDVIFTQQSCQKLFAASVSRCR